MTAEEARNLAYQHGYPAPRYQIDCNLIDGEIKTEALLGRVKCHVALCCDGMTRNEIGLRRKTLIDRYVAQGYKIAFNGYNKDTDLDHITIIWEQ